MPLPTAWSRRPLRERGVGTFVVAGRWARSAGMARSTSHSALPGAVPPPDRVGERALRGGRGDHREGHAGEIRQPPCRLGLDDSDRRAVRGRLIPGEGQFLGRGCRRTVRRRSRPRSGTRSGRSSAATRPAGPPAECVVGSPVRSCRAAAPDAPRPVPARGGSVGRHRTTAPSRGPTITMLSVAAERDCDVPAGIAGPAGRAAYLGMRPGESWPGPVDARAPRVARGGW